MFFYLYLIVDIYSRKIVGWEVHDRESSEHAATLIRKAVMAEGCLMRPLVLHADNGSPMKGATMKTTMESWASQRPTAARASAMTTDSLKPCFGPSNTAQTGPAKVLPAKPMCKLG
jgi:transposase InsO family protein